MNDKITVLNTVQNNPYLTHSEVAEKAYGVPKGDVIIWMHHLYCIGAIKSHTCANGVVRWYAA